MLESEIKVKHSPYTELDSLSFWSSGSLDVTVLWPTTPDASAWGEDIPDALPWRIMCCGRYETAMSEVLSVAEEGEEGERVRDAEDVVSLMSGGIIRTLFRGGLCAVCAW